jgi:hypothetical protein
MPSEPTLIPTAMLQGSTPTPFPPVHYQPPVSWQYRGVSLTGYWHDVYSEKETFEVVDSLQKMGVNTIQLLVSWYQDDMRSTNIYPRFDSKTPEDESVKAIIQYIHSKNMAVMLTPHVSPRKGWKDDGSESWRALIGPSDRAAWFNSYEQYIFHYIDIARAENVELFCVGSEMDSMTRLPEDQQRWASIVQKIRANYPGKLTYNAHMYEVFGGYYRVPWDKTQPSRFEATFQPLPKKFWSNFDYAGVSFWMNIYSPAKLDLPDPDISSLLDGWYKNDVADRPPEQAYLSDALSRWQISLGIPVIFTEIGYQNFDYTAYHSSVDQFHHTRKQNNQAQADAYEAAFTIWGRNPWMVGAFWWQVDPASIRPPDCMSIQEKSSNTDFSPCGRPAGEVLRKWYTMPEAPLVK